MPKPIWPPQTFPRWLIGLTLLAGLLVHAWRLGDGLLQDPFHLGEFFAALTTLATDSIPGAPSSALPLTIHGAIDVLPGALVSWWTGAAHHFLPTLLVYAALNSLAAVLALAVVARLGPPERPTPNATLLAAALLAPLCVGFRDVFLLAALLTHLALRDRIEADGVSASTTRALEVLFGLVVALGLHASFDRGLAGAIALGAGHLRRALILGRGPQPGRIALLTFGLALAGAGLLHPLLAPVHYLENVRFLAATSAQWRYPWDRHTVTLTVVLVLLCLAAWTLAVQGWRHRRPTLAQQVDLIVLAVLTLFLLRIGSNRADPQHILMGLWGPLLLAAWWHGQAGWRDHPDLPIRLARAVLIAATAVLALRYKMHAVMATSALLGLAWLADRASLAPATTTRAWPRRLLVGLTLLPVLIVAASLTRHLHDGQYRWIARLNAPWPDNASVSPAGVRWAAAALREADVACVFDLSNNGLIQALVQRPACSRITYPVYAGPAHESELIEALRRQSPSAVVSFSEHWAYAIDQRPMDRRFPALDAEIRSRYPIERCGEGHCVRLRQP